MLYPYSRQYAREVNKEPSAPPEDNFYIAQTGDTLYAISRFYNVSLDDLIESNPEIDPELITPGQKIYIPLPPPMLNCPTGAASYIISKGDTFYSVAKKHKMKCSALLKANPNINPDALLIGQSICIPKISSSYINEAYRIKLIYPYRWSKIHNERYEGIDGFFHVLAPSGSSSLYDICSREAFHKLKPYGSRPSISKTVADGHELYIIIPSTDQPMEMHRQSAIVAKYDTPVEISGKTCEYLIIRTDKNHLKDILDSLEFISG